MGILLAFMVIWNMIGALALPPALARFLLPVQGSKAGTHHYLGKAAAA